MLKSRKKNNQFIKKNPPPPQTRKSGILSTMGESMLLGTGLGIGSEAGHSIFNRIFNNNEKVGNNSEKKCEEILKLYEKCIISGDFNDGICKNIKNDFDKYC